MLSPDSEFHKELQIREDKILGIHVEGLQEYVVDNEYQAINLMLLGERNRVTRSTLLNQNSSRSHSIFQIKQEKVEGGRKTKSKLNLCDLAGSEKFNK